MGRTRTGTGVQRRQAGITTSRWGRAGLRSASRRCAPARSAPPSPPPAVMWSPGC